MKKRHNPTWWTQENDSAWDRVKAAFKRDWDQTKHDFGGREPDTDQDVDNTLKQAAGKEPIPPRRQPTYEDVEQAYKFGYGARSHYGSRHESWNPELEDTLRKDWESSASENAAWEAHREAVRKGWEYQK